MSPYSCLDRSGFLNFEAFRNCKLQSPQNPVIRFLDFKTNKTISLCTVSYK